MVGFGRADQWTWTGKPISNRNNNTSVKDARRGHAVLAQGSNEGGCFPMAMRDGADEPFAAHAAAVKPGHFGGCAALVDEDQVLRAQFRLTGAPFHTRLGDIGPILLRSLRRTSAPTIA